MKTSTALKGLAALTLTGALLVSGCKGKTSNASGSNATKPAAAAVPKTLDSIKIQAIQYAAWVDSTMATGDTNWAIYQGGRRCDEIRSQLIALGYMKRNTRGDYCFTNDGVRLLDRDEDFYRAYHRLAFSTQDRLAAFDALDQ